jgi:NAD(P)-dependent dehydrogenase (short-subunit alcohol dehydrogenase family)
MTQLRVVVTAGASGIGRCVAERFLRLGARVAICDVDSTAVSSFASAYPNALAVVSDVTNEADMAAFFALVEAEFGGADVVHANCGIGGPAGLIDDISYEDWRRTVDINLHGTFLTTRWAARVMREQGSGLIVLMSSTAGLFGYPLRSPYATAKWGIIGLTKTLAMELGPHGVRVNAICPGAVEGDRMDRVVANEAAARGIPEQEVRDQYVACTSMRTWVTADDIANMIEFLASPAGAKISGQALAVDGHTESIN